jgi:hypothetical protein
MHIPIQRWHGVVEYRQPGLEIPIVLDVLVQRRSPAFDEDWTWVSYVREVEYGCYFEV